MCASMDRAGLCEAGFRLPAAQVAGVASGHVFPQVVAGFPVPSQAGNRKLVDPGEQWGNSGFDSTQQDHDQA